IETCRSFHPKQHRGRARSAVGKGASLFLGSSPRFLDGGGNSTPNSSNPGIAEGVCIGRSNPERLASLHLQAGVTGNWRLATGNFVLCRSTKSTNRSRVNRRILVCPASSCV